MGEGTGDGGLCGIVAHGFGGNFGGEEDGLAGDGGGGGADGVGAGLFVAVDARGVDVPVAGAEGVGDAFSGGGGGGLVDAEAWFGAFQYMVITGCEGLKGGQGEG